MSSIVFTLRRSSRARAIAYRTNSDFEGKPCSRDAAKSSFACSFVSLRLIVSTRIIIPWYYLTLVVGTGKVIENVRTFWTICMQLGSRTPGAAVDTRLLRFGRRTAPG